MKVRPARYHGTIRAERQNVPPSGWLLSTQRVLVFGMWFVFFTMLVGCLAEESDRVAFSGSVTVDDVPLSKGNITLLPLDAGRSAGVEIKEGRFQFDRANGPSLGKYRVEIVAYRPTGRQIKDPDLPGRMTDETKQIIPERFNAQSELTIDVSTNLGSDNEFALSTN